MTSSGLSPAFISRTLFHDKVWVERCEETVLERPLGGSGDSCVVSRLTVWVREDEDGTTQKRARLLTRGDKRCKSYYFIVKEVRGPSERHTGFDSLKTEIKRLSYKVEGCFLSSVSKTDVRIEFVRSLYWSDEARHKSLLVEEDLVAKGFPIHAGELSADQAFIAVKWLARFHASATQFEFDASIWARGGYWSLDKRLEEFRKIRSRWKLSLQDEENSKAGFRRLPVTLAERLEKSAIALDELLYPGAPALPFTENEGRSAYDTVDLSNDEDDGRDGYRSTHLKHRVRLNMIVKRRHRPATEGTHPFLDTTLIHGDFKGENIFFSSTTCAVCDFQWVGYGLGILDMISLIFASLQPELESVRFFDEILDCYCREFNRIQSRPSSNFKADRSLLGRLFDWALVDYTRYCVGTGQLFPEDAYFLNQADVVLRRIDNGRILGPSEYKTRIFRDVGIDRLERHF